MSGVADRAKGRWRSLLPALGIDPQFLTKKHTPCPHCGGKDRFRFDDKEGRGSWICTHCGAGDGIALLTLVNGWNFKECASKVEAIVGSAPAEAPVRQASDQWVRDLLNRTWRSSNIVQDDDVVATYLTKRGIKLSAWPRELRTLKDCRLDGKPPSYLPAMIARVTGADGNPATLHRTYLSDDGRKAPISKPRKLMPCHLPKGAAIRLSEPAGILGVAEGIETALSATIIWGIPCWAAINTAMLMAWEPPQITTEVYVFGDNDPQFGGQAAAYGLAHRLSAGPRRLKVRVELPLDVGMDWNDCLQAEKS